MDFFTATFPSYKPSFALLVAVSGAMLVSQGIGFFFLRLIPLQVRMTLTIAINTLCTVMLCFIPTAVQSESLAYWLVILVSVVYGASVGLLQPTSYETAGPSAKLIIKVQIGVGLSGLLINLLRILLLVTIPSNLELNAELFFYLSAGYLALCTVLSFLFVRDFNRHLRNGNQVHDLSAFKKEAWTIYRINWKSAVGVVILCAVQFTFFPGVMLE